MNIIVCDICRRCIEGNDRSKDASMRMEDLFSSRKFTIINPTHDDSQAKELTLCTTCKESLYYYMTNREALADAVKSRTLGNRIRFLLKRPLKG